ncbi:MAG: hypothetical protein QXT53_02605 [Ignisphaera sp.]
MIYEEISQSGYSEWIEKVKELLKCMNIRFEAEESVRIHKDDVVVEIVEKGGRFTISLSIEIPKILEPSEVDRYATAYRSFLELVAKASTEPFYELDTSIGYTFLRALIDVDNVEQLIDKLKTMLS